ncbi:Pescadillo N-terminus-domain-containing protein [Daldinia caldariorum]|uniref:Pescadillo N-terminus-domain-containing protein n=1 Tax=Daldinia caldariorum TaxID=326644 RepID=UPI002007FB30|nr:Pescadillo N-terminus-domain-containing protein [Daldinia caldariorum]KAI1464019.1 Pescadillo N-terminus-domain-containing protein [Daldinia caldariorum]
MGRIKKKGEAGNAKNYITRTQAVKKLQISLPDFRKLCIWKGIFPREPRSRKKVSKSSTASTTFYYAKDIQYLLHEPLLQKFREQKALEKKISRALGRGDVSDASRLERNASRPEKTGKPRYTLDHVIRERYPTFVDAVRDLDDCLSMLFLFANLPSTSTVPAKMIARCERLCLEFQHYLIVSQSLRKSFLSIKGIYYQANIQGEDVLWLVPYKFNQRVVGDVDFRIMGTFVEFYMTLLGFVNFRLYTSVGLKYPPKFDQAKDDAAGELGAFRLEGNLATAVSNEAPAQLTNGEPEAGPDPKTQAEVNKLIKEMREVDVDGERVETSADKEESATDVIDKFEPAAPGGDILPQPSYSGSEPESLFANCTFYLSRETPRQPLEFILRAFGCKRIGWDAVLGEGAYTTNERDPSITHQIVDRPVIQAVTGEGGDGEDNQTSQKLASNQRIPGRIYVQPQWVWDSINDGEMKRPDLYAPGAQLPPHLSPFVQNAQGAYDPTIPLEEQQTEGEALQDSEEESDEDEEVDGDEDDDNLVVKGAETAADSMDIAQSDDDDDENSANDTFGGFSDEAKAADGSEDEEQAAELQYQRELEAELTGKPVKQTPSNPQSKAKVEARKRLAKQAKEEAEELERAKGMLSKKKRKLFEQMQYTNNKKSAEDQKLREKRRKLEKQKAKGKA